MKLRSLLASMLASVTIPAAASVTYNYVGNDFTSGFNGAPLDPKLGLRITASVIFDDDVGPNFTGDGYGHILKASLSSGLIAVSTGESRFSYFGVELVNGELKHWALYGAERDGGTELGTQNSGAEFSNFVGDISIVEGTERANIVRSSGIWSRIASPVPIPASLPLIGSALGALGLGRRRWMKSVQLIQGKT